MTVSSENKRADYNGDGVTVAFATGFRFLENADLKVIQTVISTGVETLLTLGTDYTVSGAGDDAGGTVTTTTAPASGEKLSILRDVSLTQELDYVENDSFPAESHEKGLDKLTMIAQQILESVERSLSLPESSQFPPSIPEPVPLKYIRVNSAGTAFELTDGTTSVVASDIPYTAGGTGALTTNVQEKLSRHIDAGDYDTLTNAVAAAQASGIGWIQNGSELIYTGATGAQIHGSQSDGSDTGALALGAGGTESSTRGAVINLYGEQHASWPGMLFLTPVTDAALGRTVIESNAMTRRGLVVNSRHDLVMGAYDALDVQDPGGSLVVYGDAGSLGTDPSITGFTAASNADIAVFQQKTSSNGITIATENNVAGRIAFGDPDNSGAGQIVYDHSDDSLQFANVNGALARFLANGVMLIGKTSSDVSVDGIELNDDGFVQATNDSAITARFNRKTTLGDIVEFRHNGSVIGSIAGKDGNYIKVVYGSGGPIDTAGPGTPEGVVTAPVGSTYRRTDGGAGTSFYVKESGTGNTGWVAK